MPLFLLASYYLNEPEFDMIKKLKVEEAP